MNGVAPIDTGAASRTRPPFTILIVEDHPTDVEVMLHALEAADLRPLDREWDMEVRATAEGALQLLQERPIDLVLADVMLPRMDGIALAGRIQALDRNLPVLLVTRVNTVDAAVEAMRRGAFDYILKPVRPDDLAVRLHRAIRISEILRRQESFEQRAQKEFPAGSFIGIGPAYQRVMRLVREAAQVRSTVLITGETGTGKGVVARAVHEQSADYNKVFQVIDCTTVPEGVMESELFGHVRGAFTGAVTDKPGLIEMANGGTVFFDEIGDLPLPLQAKLLRVLEENEVRPVGSMRPRRVDMRFIAATNRNLEDQVREGTFRKDLFYRLAVLSIPIPPLRDRSEDIPVIARHLVTRLGRELGKPHAHFSQRAIQELVLYPFPGNVRELRNIVERSVMLSNGEEITAEQIVSLLGTLYCHGNANAKRLFTELPYAEAKEQVVGEFTRAYLQAKLRQHEGVITKAAESSQIARQHFSLLMARYLQVKKE